MNEVVANVPGDTKPLLVTFDNAGLQAAAKSLQTSPPLERTTPFISSAAD